MPTTSILRDSEAVRAAVLQSTSMKGALTLLGLRAAGGNYRALHEACARSGVEAPVCMAAPPVGRRFEPIPDSEIFCENSTYLKRGRIKARLIELGMPERCAECGLAPEWNGRPLTLQLDHINGVFNDNRFENLRLLCPNCHSQTETFAGKRSSVRKLFTGGLVCDRCGHLNQVTAQRCSICKHWFVPPAGISKITWPSDEDLLVLVRDKTLVAVEKDLGVSDTAVRKRLQSRGLAGCSPATHQEPSAGIELAARQLQAGRSAK